LQVIHKDSTVDSHRQSASTKIFSNARDVAATNVAVIASCHLPSATDPMANAQPQPPAATPDPVKRRAVRRLIAALALIAIAVVGLAVMDRMARKKTEAPAAPKTPVAQAPVATPTPALPPTEPAAPADEAAPPADASATPGDALAPSAPSATGMPPLEPPPPPDVSAEVPPSPYATRKRAAARALPESTEGVGAPQPKPAPKADLQPAPSPSAAPKPAAAAAPESAGAAAPAAYVVQVGVFASPINAEVLRDRLVKVGIPAHTETRLNVGPFADKAEAERMLHRLRRLGMQAVMVPQTK
jgi:cell division protein FtsN